MLTPEQIKTAREAAKLSTAEAAELVGVTRRAWQLWESGDRKMDKRSWELFTIKTKDRANEIRNDEFSGPARDDADRARVRGRIA